MNAAPLRPRLLLAAVLLVAVFRPPAAAAATPARDAIEVKFAEGAPVRLREGRLTSSNEGDPGGVEAALLRHPVLAGERLFSQPEEEVARERGTLVAPAGGDLPDLNRWYRLTLAPGTDVEALLDALKALPEVERAYPAPLPAPPPGAVSRGARGGERSLLAESPTPSYFALQGYERAATTGIDAGFAWAKAGGNGSRATIVDVEYSFNPGHEDLPTIPVIGGVLYGGYGDDHGTAVLGELAGTNNGSGVLGVAHGARILFSAACGDSACSAYTPADAINNARLATAPGDVILIEQQTRVCNSGYGPLEWIASVYDAVVVATAARRTVVEAAGNGGVDLDQPGCAGAFDRAVRDSGAIIVGAGAPPGRTQRDRSRLGFSSYGSRVDAQGWGARRGDDGVRGSLRRHRGGPAVHRLLQRHLQRLPDRGRRGCAAQQHFPAAGDGADAREDPRHPDGHRQPAAGDVHLSRLPEHRSAPGPQGGDHRTRAARPARTRRCRQRRHPDLPVAAGSRGDEVPDRAHPGRDVALHAHRLQRRLRGGGLLDHPGCRA